MLTASQPPCKITHYFRNTRQKSRKVAEKLDINPIPFLITEIMASNIGGTATLIGDPPNIIIGSAAGLSFMDFLYELTGIVVVILLVVVAILAIASGLVATNFITLTGKREVFEDEVLAKHVAEAGYAFFDSKKNKPDGVTRLNEGCKSIQILIDNGYLSEDQGLLKKYNQVDSINENSLKNFYYETTMVNGQKTTRVYKRTKACSGAQCCSSSYATKKYELPIPE